MLSFFAAFEDISPQQGGTVFVPGTHKYAGVEKRHGGAGLELMNLFMIRTNIRIFAHNFRKLWGMRKGVGGDLAPGEFRDRVFSTKWDEYQPNILRFLMNRNTHLSLGTFRRGTLRALWRNRQAISDSFSIVRTAPRKGTVIVFRSDTIHAGPDNCSPQPRRLYGMSISRDIIDPVHLFDGYSPHPELVAEPLTLGDLLAMPPLVAPAKAASPCEAVPAE